MPTSTGAVTWDDVAPILEARCTGCHQADGVGPMSLASYESAAPWAESIKVDTADRIMPPWLVVDDGSCGTYADSQWLSDDEIAGFALIIEHCPITGRRPCYFIAEFFVMRPYRRQGFGTGCALGLISEYPGLWHIGVIEKNDLAAKFWSRFFEPFETHTSHHDHDGEHWLVYEFEA